MDLMEKLLASDGRQKKAEKRVRSARLSALLGENAYITIREVGGREFSQVKEAAEGMPEEGYELALMLSMKCITEPDLKNLELMEKFNAATPKDLCERLFQGEAYRISDEIIRLSGLDASEDDVKN